MTKEEERDKLKKELQGEFVVRWGGAGYDDHGCHLSSGDFAARAVQQLTERLADLMVRVDQLERDNEPAHFVASVEKLP